MKAALAAILIAVLMIVPATAWAATVTVTPIDSDGDGITDREDPYPYDRDNDGIPDDEDRYPDDPYNREDLPEDDPADDEAAQDGDSSPMVGDDEVCCLINLWWLWVLAGIVMIAADKFGITFGVPKGIMTVVGAAFICIGLYLGGFLGFA